MLLLIKLFSKDVGAPEALITYGSKAKTGEKVKRLCVNIGTNLKILEQVAPWANLVELHVRILKSRV